MRTYARIVDGIVVELFDTDADIATLFHAEMVWVDITDAKPVRPAERWTAVQTAGGWSFSAPAALALTWQQYQGEAQAALEASDRSVMRAIEQGITISSEWRTYRTELRAIVGATTGDATKPLPVRPAYQST